MNQLSVADLVALNQEAISETGGTHAVLKQGVLESAVHRPYQEVFGQTLFPSPLDKAAAVAETIAHDHPFVDGNKRTASLALTRVLALHGLRLRLDAVEYDEYMDCLVEVAAGQIGWQELSEWLKRHVELLTNE